MLSRPRRRLRTLVASTLLVMTCAAPPATAQDFRALQDTVPPDPKANLAPALAPAALIAPRLLLAGDSWAQYLWDDGTRGRHQGQTSGRRILLSD